MPNLRVAFRIICRNKWSSLINIAGLALGFTVLMSVLLYLQGELTFEDFHRKSERIFRLTMHVQSNQYDMHWARMDRDYINNLPDEFPGIEEMIRFQNYYPRDIRIGEDVYRIDHAFSTDNAVFNVFEFKLLQGDESTALSKPHSAVLTTSTAKKFFGQTDVMGKFIEIADNNGAQRQVHEITGIMADVPSNTHLPVNMLTSFASEEERSGWAYTYLLLSDGGYASELQDGMPEYILKNGGEEEAGLVTFPLQNLNDIHLSGGLVREIIPVNELRQVLLVTSAGLLVFVLIVINFINLTTAQAMKRTGEIGIRKVLGAKRSYISSQFFLESFILASMAILVALALLHGIRPNVQEILPSPVTIGEIFPFIILTALLVAAMATYYPVLILTAKGSSQTIGKPDVQTSSRSGFRTALVGFQMVLCISMVSAAFISTSQLSFISGKDLGFNKSQLLAIRSLQDPLKEKIPFIKNSLQDIDGVEDVSAVMEVPSREIRDAGPVYLRSVSWTAEDAPVFDAQVVDADFADLMNLQYLSGSGFAEKHNTDWESIASDPVEYLINAPREYVINESALHQLGFASAEEAIGEYMRWEIGRLKLQDGPIVGVVKDYHQETLKNTVDPLVMFQEPYWTRNLLLRIKPGATHEAIASIADLWEDGFSEYPLETTWLDDMYRQLYEQEERQIALLKYFSILAVTISFLGIFGLLTYVMKNREKELAIRKILGASLSSIISLVSRRFVITALGGTAIAIPITWILMRRWLNGYAYRIELSPWFFAAGVLLVVAVFVLVVLWQAKRLSSTNPADILRSE